MRNYITLTKVLFKTSLSSLSDGKSKKKWMVLLYIFLGICMLPMMGTLYMMFDAAFDAFIPLDQGGTIIAAGAYMSAIVTFIFSFLLAPSIFYFSKDISLLLYMPLKPQTIISSKFSVSLVYEYLFTALVMLPMYAALINANGFDFLQFIFFIILFLFIPVLPLVYSSIITMLLMRFVPFFKNRDRFNLIAGILGMAIGLAFSFSMQSMVLQDPQELMMMLSEGNNSMISLISSLFPSLSFAAAAIYNTSFIDFLIAIGISVLSVVIFLVVARMVYFKGAIGVGEVKSSHKKMSESAFRKTTKQRSILWTYTIKELKLLIRTPVFFLNCILGSFIIPIIMLVPLVLQDTLSQIAPFISFIDWNSSEVIMIALPCAFALGILNSNLNMISASAISREGTNIIFMKYIPVPIMTQINAKALSGIIISELGYLFMVLPIIIFLQFPIVIALLCIIIGSLAVVVGNYLGMLCDLIHPKLVWEQEASAVKQNMSSALSMLLSMGICIALIGSIFVVDESMRSTIFYASMIITILLVPISYKGVQAFAKKRFQKIS